MNMACFGVRVLNTVTMTARIFTSLK